MALLAVLPVCVKGRDPRVIVEIVGQDSGVVIKPKEVMSASDPPLLALRELWEPEQKEPLRVCSFGEVMLWEENALG